MPTPAIEGWFTLDEREPHLIGTRCTACGTYFFPKENGFCRNPSCTSTDLEDVPMSRRGRVWSYTINHYDPPPPSVTKAPYGVAAVELAEERMIVLGQIAGDLDDVGVGDEVELVVEPLEGERVVWKWRKA
jgi:uncharacterized OB-fold protein